MRQGSFAEGGLERYRKRTRRERFLQEMEHVVPLGGVVQSSLAVLSEGERGNVHRLVWSGCFGFTFSSIGSVCWTRR